MPQLACSACLPELHLGSWEVDKGRRKSLLGVLVLLVPAEEVRFLCLSLMAVFLKVFWIAFGLSLRSSITMLLLDHVRPFR